MTTVYTYTDTDARQNFTSLLDRAADEGEVRVKRGDGQMFVIKPEEVKISALDIEGMDLNITGEEIAQYIAENRGHLLFQKDEVLRRFDKMMGRLAERNADYNAEEVAADVAAAIVEVRAASENQSLDQ